MFFVPVDVGIPTGTSEGMDENTPCPSLNCIPSPLRGSLSNTAVLTIGPPSPSSVAVPNANERAS